MELVDSNVKLQLIKRQNEESLVLNLLFRACPPAISVAQKGFAGRGSGPWQLRGRVVTFTRGVRDHEVGERTYGRVGVIYFAHM